MRTLALMEQGLRVAVKDGHFVVERASRVVQEVRVAEVSDIVVFGNVALTPTAVSTVLRRGIDTVYLSATGRYYGRLVGPTSRNIELRVAQFDRLRQDEVSLRLASAIVAGKIANQRQVLLRAQREHRHEGLGDPIGALRTLAGSALRASALDELRGIEGRAAAVYFGAFPFCIRNPAFAFSGRSKRPPKDAVNAMLSFGYTMLGIVMERHVQRIGLDPMLGALHAPEYGRSSLVLDLIEEFRPLVVDALTLRLVNRREVGPGDFEPAGAPDDDDEGDSLDVASSDGREDSGRTGAGVWLSDTGRRVFFRAWGRRLKEVVLYPAQNRRLAMEDIMQQQAYAAARFIEGSTSSYEPMSSR